MKHWFYTIMLLLGSAKDITAQSQIQDSLALVDLYNATNGSNWRVNTNWLVQRQPIQNWYGITVDLRGRVTSIILNSNNLQGSIPTTLSNCTSLLTIKLINNQLSGSIPNFNLPNLQYLWLHSNRLTGSIPHFTLRSLIQLDVSNNQLTGSVPNFIVDTLQAFQFYKNQIDSLPNFSRLLNLSVFTGDSNRLTFDDILPNLSRRMIYIRQDSIFKDTTFSHNAGQSLTLNLGIDAALTTNVYKWFKNGALYQTTNVNQLIFNSLSLSDAGLYTCEVTNPNAPLLTLYSRKITILVAPAPVNVPCRTRDSLALVDLYNQNATLPATRIHLNNWLSITSLQNWNQVTLNANGCVSVLDLANIGLTRRLTNSIGNLTQLEELYLQNNNLDSTLPNSMKNLISLKNLLLSNNLVTGLPDSIEKMVSLRELDLDDNLLTGNIPSNLGLLSRMRLLKLSNNDFTGKIPSNLGNLANLQDLNLSDNQLSDSIPSSLGNLSNLKKLYLDRNRLTGKIPHSFRQLNVLTEFNFGSNDIDSLIHLSSLSNLTLCDARDNHLTFDDILPNLGRPFTLIYTPQDTIFKEITYNRSLGNALTIDLSIDGGLTTNVYKWFKNGVPMDTIIRSNKLIINYLSRNDVGVYSCEVRNPNAPNLVLYTRKARVNMNCATTVTKTEGVCNTSYVGTSFVATYDANSPLCDSLVTITHRVLDKCACLQDSTIIYNGLIPNDGDNQNDYFTIPLITQYLPNELIITDKRGMLIYQAKDYQNNWTGTNQKGEPLPEGIYNFVFRTMNPNCMRMGVIDIKYIP